MEESFKTSEGFDKKERGGRKFDKTKGGGGFIHTQPVFDYKDVELLRRYISEEGKIVPSRISRLTAKQQRQLALAVKRARQLALIPVCAMHKRF